MKRTCQGTASAVLEQRDAGRGFSRWWSIVTLIVLFLSTEAFAQSRIAILRQSTGDVAVRHVTQWTTVTQTPVDLFDGDKVVSNRGRAEIFYPGDGSTLTVDVGSNVTIHQTQNNSGGWLNRVKVYVGDVFFHISKTAETHNSWQLATPTAVGGVQGTEGQIHVEDEDNSDFTLNEGALEVHHVSANGVPIRDESPIRIGAGESVQAKPGVALVRAKALRQVRIPRADIKPEELPRPTPGHFMRTQPGERPPRAFVGAGGAAGFNNPNAARRNAASPAADAAPTNAVTPARNTARPNAEPKQSTAPRSIAPRQSEAAKPNTETPLPSKAQENKEEKKEEKRQEEGEQKGTAPKKPLRKVAPLHRRG